MSQDFYQQFYESGDELFGSEPEACLINHVNLLSAGDVVLDIGAGQGRNSLYLLEKGILVDALDPAEIAMQSLSADAGDRYPGLRTYVSGFEEFSADRLYKGILIFGLIPDLDWKAINALQEKVNQLSDTGSMIWISGFTNLDAALPRYRASWQEIYPDSFRGSDGRIRTYLKPSQITELFSNCELLHHWEGFGPWHSHGDGNREQHAMFEAIFKRR